MNPQEIADARRDANAAIDAFVLTRGDATKPGFKARGDSIGQWTVFRLALYLLQAISALEEAREDLKKYEAMVSDRWMEVKR